MQIDHVGVCSCNHCRYERADGSEVTLYADDNVRNLRLENPAATNHLWVDDITVRVTTDPIELGGAHHHVPVAGRQLPATPIWLGQALSVAFEVVRFW